MSRRKCCCCTGSCGLCSVSFGKSLQISFGPTNVNYNNGIGDGDGGEPSGTYYPTGNWADGGNAFPGGTCDCSSFCNTTIELPRYADANAIFGVSDVFQNIFGGGGYTAGGTFNPTNPLTGLPYCDLPNFWDYPDCCYALPANGMVYTPSQLASRGLTAWNLPCVCEGIVAFVGGTTPIMQLIFSWTAGCGGDSVIYLKHGWYDQSYATIPTGDCQKSFALANESYLTYPAINVVPCAGSLRPCNFLQLGGPDSHPDQITVKMLC